ncbi:MAG: site-2 protease family protein [Phycisphaerae bacterium]
MGWQDRPYNRGSEAAHDFFGNPAGLLALSVPFGKFPGLTIRLHFWLLLNFVFVAISIIQGMLPLYFIPVNFALTLALLLVHEFGHRFWAQRVGGNHWEFVLWPLGGMTTPHCPRTPWATFVANAGGILFTLPLGLAAAAVALTLPHTHVVYGFSVDPFMPLLFAPAYAGSVGNPLVVLGYYVLSQTVIISAALVAINLFPAYWFDGGYIWQSILWPKLGHYRAISLTCIAGMVLSAVLFLLALHGQSLMGMVLWGIIFWTCLIRRRALVATGPGLFGDEEDSDNYMDIEARGSRHRKHLKKSWLRKASRKAALERAEQEKIDAILSKVHEKGLHSLTWWEKRTLKKATERQRQQDLAEKL